MLYYLVTREHAYTIQLHLDTWGRGLRCAVVPIFYDQLAYYRRLPVGTYFFSDLERLGDAQMELARVVWNALAQSGRPLRQLNDPAKVLRREALLATLHRNGVNPFAVHRADQALGRVHYPAFVRRPDEHDGNLTPLLQNDGELAGALAKLRNERGFSPERLLVVEFCDTGDASGVYRKYAAFVVGDRIIPRHLFLSRNWMIKNADLVDAESAAEESAYLAKNPHEEQLRVIFALAGVNFGRIDYGVRDGKLVVWEINTNPMMGVDPAKLAPVRLAGQSTFFKKFNDAMVALDVARGAPDVAMAVPASLRRALGVTGRTRALRNMGRILGRLGQMPPWRAAIEAAS